MTVTVPNGQWLQMLIVEPWKCTFDEFIFVNIKFCEIFQGFIKKFQGFSRVSRISRASKIFQVFQDFQGPYEPCVKYVSDKTPCYIFYIYIQCVLLVTAIMALEQLMNLGTQCTVTVIPQTCVGYELLDSGRGAEHWVGYPKIISKNIIIYMYIVQLFKTAPIHVCTAFIKAMKIQGQNAQYKTK